MKSVFTWSTGKMIFTESIYEKLKLTQKIDAVTSSIKKIIPTLVTQFFWRGVGWGCRFICSIKAFLRSVRSDKAKQLLKWSNFLYRKFVGSQHTNINNYNLSRIWKLRKTLKNIYINRTNFLTIQTPDTF